MRAVFGVLLIVAGALLPVASYLLLPGSARLATEVYIVGGFLFGVAMGATGMWVIASRDRDQHST